MTPCPNHIKLWGQILSPCEEIVKVFDLRSDNYSLAKFMVLLNISNIKDIVLSVVGNTKVNKTWHLCTNFWSCSKADVKNKWLQLVLSIYFVPGPVLSVLSAFWVFHSWFFYLYEVEITDFFFKDGETWGSERSLNLSKVLTASMCQSHDQPQIGDSKTWDLNICTL